MPWSFILIHKADKTVTFFTFCIFVNIFSGTESKYYIYLNKVHLAECFVSYAILTIFVGLKFNMVCLNCFVFKISSYPYYYLISNTRWHYVRPPPLCKDILIVKVTELQKQEIYIRVSSNLLTCTCIYNDFSADIKYILTNKFEIACFHNYWHV